MLNFLYKVYNKKFNNSKIDEHYVRIIVRLSNIIFPIIFWLIRYNRLPHSELNKGFNKDTFIVSLTTFPIRINKVWLTIESILQQTEKPDKIILWLYSGEFGDKNSLPKNLLRLEKRGLEIRLCDKNLMPHKKYFYAMQEFPDANIITIDDDWIYPPNLIYNLKIYHRKYPESIICPFTRRIKIENNDIRPYKEWSRVWVNTEPTFFNLTMGGGGTLFPPGSLHNDTFNIKLIEKLALNTDDLWLKVMSLKNNTKVVSIAGEFPRNFIYVIIKNDKKLIENNIFKLQNDEVFKVLINFYNISLDNYF